MELLFANSKYFNNCTKHLKYWVNCAKNKVMLDLYGQLLQKHCFSRSEVESLVGNRKKTDNVIYALKAKGLIKSVRKNLYTAISLEDKSPVSSKYEIASHISHGSFISHHTAFEFYGLANQLYYEVFVSSNTRFNNFAFEDEQYVFVQNKYNFGIEEIKHVRVADMERTVLDSIKDFEKIAGFEELVQCISLVKHLDEKKLLLYLEQYDNQFLYQKTGFILRTFTDLELPDSFYTICKEKSCGSVRYLCAKSEYPAVSFNKEWNMCVPQKIDNILMQGVDADV